MDPIFSSDLSCQTAVTMDELSCIGCGQSFSMQDIMVLAHEDELNEFVLML